MKMPPTPGRQDDFYGQKVIRVDNDVYEYILKVRDTRTLGQTIREMIRVDPAVADDLAASREEWMHGSP